MKSRSPSELSGLGFVSVRRLVARTMAQKLSKAVERATAPFQYALSTRAGCECIAHVLQGITELHPELTITSIDGISRESMLRGLLSVEGGGAALPFVRMSYGPPSEYLWEDDEGTVHRIPQGEESEQGDATMPLLFAVGQHGALEAIHRRMNPGEFLMAFQGDYVWADVRSGARRTLCALCHPGSPRQDQGVESGRGSVLSVATHLSRLAAQKPRCGQVPQSHLLSKASKCWERRSVIPTSSPLSWRQ